MHLLGWFYSPRGEATPYALVVEGPVEFQFSRDIALHILELKIVKNWDPLMLIGADLMKLFDQPWWFSHVGFCPRTRRAPCNLSGFPHNADKRHLVA